MCYICKEQSDQEVCDACLDIIKPQRIRSIFLQDILHFSALFVNNPTEANKAALYTEIEVCKWYVDKYASEYNIDSYFIPIRA